MLDGSPGPLMRLPDVMQATGLKRSMIYALLRADPPRFPRQVALTARCVGWRSGEVVEWIKSRQPAH